MPCSVPDHDLVPPEPGYGGVVGEPEDEPLWPPCVCGCVEADHNEDGCTGCDGCGGYEASEA